jgi:hypothetical protein
MLGAGACSGTFHDRVRRSELQTSRRLRARHYRCSISASCARTFDGPQVMQPVGGYFFLLYSEHQPFGLIAPSTTAQLPGA